MKTETQLRPPPLESYRAASIPADLHRALDVDRRLDALELAEHRRLMERLRRPGRWARAGVQVALVSLLLGAGALLGVQCSAHAQAPDEALALAIAKVSANEASLSASRADIALIWQTAHGHGRTYEQRLAWLTRHSSCVLTDRPLRRSETRTGCIWTRHLRDDDSEPAGWEERYGPWERYVPRWRRIRAYALQLVRGEVSHRPCAITPSTWGGAMDRERAIARGLRMVACLGTRNDGWVRP